MTRILPHLPVPAAPALEHSARLRALIAERLRASGGWIDFEQFMQLALYAPGLGYYSAGSQKFGPHGDFTTAPELTPLFGATVAQAIAHCCATAPASILELGAGSGRLARDILLRLNDLEQLPGEYGILEPSPDLRARQRDLLAELPAALSQLVRWHDQWPARIDGVILANEVLDAIPVRRVQWEDSRWFEQGVGFRLDQPENPDSLDSGWQLQIRALQNERLQAALPPSPERKQNGYVSEVGVLAQDLMACVAHSLQSGVAIFIDYGFPAREYYHPQRHQGTLMCHYRHHAHPDPLLYPGLQDITAHVDFSAIARAALANGLGIREFQTQAAWLLGHGILDLLSRHDPQAAAQFLPHSNAMNRLLSPAEMGELFKVLVLSPGPSTPAALAQLGL